MIKACLTMVTFGNAGSHINVFHRSDGEETLLSLFARATPKLEDSYELNRWQKCVFPLIHQPSIDCRKENKGNAAIVA